MLVISSPTLLWGVAKNADSGNFQKGALQNSSLCGRGMIEKFYMYAQLSSLNSFRHSLSSVDFSKFLTID